VARWVVREELEAPELVMTVLVVGDDTIEAAELELLENNRRFNFMTVSSPIEGLERLRSDPHITVVVAGHPMPDMGGIDFFEQVQTIAPIATRALVSEELSSEILQDAINRGGVQRLLRKPCTASEMWGWLRTLAADYERIEKLRCSGCTIEQTNRDLSSWARRLRGQLQERVSNIHGLREQVSDVQVFASGMLREAIAARVNLVSSFESDSLRCARRVAHLAREIGEDASLPSEDLGHIPVAAMLFNMGGGQILARPGVAGGGAVDLRAFDTALRRIKSCHSALDAADDLRIPARLLRHLGEWFNGSGTPDHLSGEMIPIGARIIAVAAYAILCMPDDPSSPQVEMTLKYVEAHLGTRFDPSLAAPLANSLDNLYRATLHSEVPDVEALLWETEQELFEEADAFVPDPISSEPTVFTPVAEEAPPAPAKSTGKAKTLDELEPGMVLEEDLYSATGVLLMLSGTTLTEMQLERLLSLREREARQAV